MDFLISDGSEWFLTKVERFRSEFGSVRNPEKPQFGSENNANIVLNFRKPIYKYKLLYVQVVLERCVQGYISQLTCLAIVKIRHARFATEQCV